MKIVWTDIAWKEYTYWASHNQKIINRINQLIKNIEYTPFTGLGKPEPLRFGLHGKWSRRINIEHRLVYEIIDDKIIIYTCRYHY
jgi:toxin YoeB